MYGKTVSKSTLLWCIAMMWLVILPVLGVWHWEGLNRLRDSDQRLMADSLQNALTAYRNDFDEEITHLSRRFQISHGEDPASELASSYQQFTSDNPHADLLDRVYLITRHSNDLEIEEYLPWEESLSAVQWPAMRAQMRREKGVPHRGVGYRDRLGTVTIPTYNGLGSRSESWVMLTLNESYIAGHLLPKLTFKHLRDAPYEVMVVDNQDRLIYTSNYQRDRAFFENADARARIFALRNKRNPSEGNWQLLVKHQAGSLLAAANTVRNRQAGIILGALLFMGSTFFLPLLILLHNKNREGRQLAFFSGLSHDLRAPLSVISSAAHNLSRSVVTQPERVKQYGALIGKEGKRLQDMVNHVLEFSRAHGEGDNYHLTEQNTDRLIGEVLEEHEGLLQKYHMEVNVIVKDEIPQVNGDKRALKSALGNLISNAVKYGGERHWLGIRAFVDGQDIKIEVSDRGKGIPASEQARLFEPYFRAESARNSGIEGSGLGLNMVKKIMARHGGAVHVRSYPGEGSTFSLTLPMMNSQTQTEHGGLLTWKKRFSW